MRTNTLAGAYLAKLGRPAQPAPIPLVLPTAAPIEASMPPHEVLLIALRRSLASCRDTSQLRTLAAFEAMTGMQY